MLPTPATSALYYHSPDLRFTARVTARRGVGPWEVALDATAFYPQGGGQNADTGQLCWEGGAAQVCDVHKDKASGVIWHALTAQGPAVGQVVAGAVDAAGRFTTSQRHTAEHLLAQAFHRLNPAFAVAAVGMRSAECTLDVRGHPTPHDWQAAEALLRQVLGRTPLRLRTLEVPQADLGAYPLRRESKVERVVRLVIFEDAAGEAFDVSACGGLHLPWAAQCAPVVVLRAERIKGDLTRVVFMAGEEASAYLSGLHQRARDLAATFSAGVDALPDRVAALRAQHLASQQQAAQWRRDLAAARVVLASSESVGRLTLRALTLNTELYADALAAVPAGEVLLLHGAEGRCAVASAHPEVNAAQVLRAALGLAGGKGGGNAQAAQGVTHNPSAFEAAVRGLLREQLPALS